MRVLGHVPPLIARLTRGKTLPLSMWLSLRRFGRHADSLAPVNKPTLGSALADPALAFALAEVELGTWSLGSASIDVLARAVDAERPAAILEFGSGVSTVCLAHFASQLDPAPKIVSIEQDAVEVARTTHLLDRLPKVGSVHIIHAPLVDRIVAGRSVESYSLPIEELELVLGGTAVDLLLIDGPAAGDGARYGTLPLVMPYLAPRALVLLDDALRDGELEAAREWERRGFVSVEGVMALDHGLLVARSAASWSAA